MKNSTLNLMLLASMLFFASLTSAEASGVNILRATNPPNSNAIQMGDVLNRTFEIEVDAAYQIPKTSLPMKGETRNGIELRDITVQASKHSHSNIYTIALSYQIFASAAQPLVLQLPHEHIALIGGKEALSIEIPAWGFWYSPLVAEGISNAKENMQPQSKPAQIDLKVHYTRLWFSLVLLALGLLGLVYINADKRWLPFMNGAFAQTHRSIKKLRHDQASNKNALIYMHQAFNEINGTNLFANELDQFLVANPKFLKLNEDIRRFFEQSNAALFANQYKNDAQYLKYLMVLSKRLRDCERGV